MGILDSYRKSAFLQNEPGGHLDQWRAEAYWKSVQSASGAQRPRGWNHYVLEPPERALDYLEWLNHRHSGMPYLLRRFLLPTWLLTRIIEAVAHQQIDRIRRFDRAQPYPVETYAAKAKAWEHEIQRCLKGSGWFMPLVRAIRLSSEWLRAREKLIQASIEAKHRESGSVPEPIEVRARPWDNLGVGTWKANDTFSNLLALQQKADAELFIVLADFNGVPVSPHLPKTYFLPKDGNPRIDRNRYLFETPQKCIAYLIWLNHRHPNRAYALRRILLPVRTLTRFVEAIAHYQISQILKLQKAQEALSAYNSQAATWAKEIDGCINQKKWAVPMMRVIRLNSEWLRERQKLIESNSPKGLHPTASQAEPIEVNVNAWKQASGAAAPVAQVLRELLALQLKADKELSIALAKIEE